MPHMSASRSLLGLVRGFGKLDVSDPLMQCLAPQLSRSFASQTSLPAAELVGQAAAASAEPKATIIASPSSLVLTTLHQWPQIEPTRFAWYNEKLLNLPLRKDILHRAVIFEADASRQGTASAKHRTAVHGSNRKIQPQKGLGRARAGDKKSPIRRGGGKAFGPHPRDFSTELQRKVYDIAWRTALSHRYRKGELIVLENRMTLPDDASGGRFLHNFFEANQWGRGNGRSMLVTRNTTLRQSRPMKRAMAQVGEHGLFKDVWDVDVKDLLETGRVIIEKDVLDALLFAHARDLGVKVSLRYALHTNKEAFLQNALPMPYAPQMGAEQATRGDMLDQEEEFEMEDALEVEDPPTHSPRIDAR